MGRPTTCRPCQECPEPGCLDCGTLTLSFTVPSLPMACPVSPCPAGTTSPEIPVTLELQEAVESQPCFYYGATLGDWSAGAAIRPLYSIGGAFLGWILTYTVVCGTSFESPTCSRGSPTYFSETCTGTYVVTDLGGGQGPHPDTIDVS